MQKPHVLHVTPCLSAPSPILLIVLILSNSPSLPFSREGSEGVAERAVAEEIEARGSVRVMKTAGKNEEPPVTVDRVDQQGGGRRRGVPPAGERGRHGRRRGSSMNDSSSITAGIVSREIDDDESAPGSASR